MLGYILMESVLTEMREWASETGVTPESILVLGDTKDLGCFIRLNTGIIQHWLIEMPKVSFSEWLDTKPSVIRIIDMPWSPALEEAIWVVGWRVVLLLALKFVRGDVIVVSDHGSLEILSMA